MKKKSLQYIADKTGVSVSTVSRVLSGNGEKYRISQKTIAAVKFEADKIDYMPDLIAKGLRTNRTDTIGLTVPNIDNPFFANLSCIVISELKQRGYHVLLADSMELDNEERDALNMFISRKVDGIIAVPVSASPSLYEEIAAHTPVVLVDRYFDETSLPYICTNNYIGSRMATDYLIRKGHRDLLAIEGNRRALSNRDRTGGFLDEVKSKKGISIRTRTVGNAFSVENGYNETMAVLKSGDLPDAIFAFSTTILLGSIQALREYGIRIPEEISLISFDNNGFLDFLDPAVTRIEQPLTEIGRRSTEILSELIENRRKELPDPKPIQELLKPSLVVRDSC